jgi:hypothetical protein
MVFCQETRNYILRKKTLYFLYVFYVNDRVGVALLPCREFCIQGIRSSPAPKKLILDRIVNLIYNECEIRVRQLETKYLKQAGRFLLIYNRGVY